MASTSFHVDLIHRDGKHSLTQIIPSSHLSIQGFESTESLYDGNSTVQRGLALGPDGTRYDAVCKFVRGDPYRLRNEAKLYADPDHLLHLQGYSVPMFFGYYECPIVEYEQDALLGCMILEYCGRTLSRAELLNKKIQIKILDRLVNIHSVANVVHGDLESGFHHILAQEGDRPNYLDVRIVDFDHASHHKCERGMTIDMGGWEPSPARFGCPELFTMAQALGVWTPSQIHFLGSYLNIFRVATVERLMKWARDQRHLDYLSDKYLEREARLTLDEYYHIFAERLRRIGDPREHMLALRLKNEIIGDSSLGNRPDLPEAKWRDVVPLGRRTSDSDI